MEWMDAKEFGLPEACSFLERERRRERFLLDAHKLDTNRRRDRDVAKEREIDMFVAFHKSNKTSMDSN